jgi:uncharacterized protein with HEPN domain
MKDSHLESLMRLQHIAEAIAKIQKFVAGNTLVSFCESDLVHDAVLFQFTVIGEAINFVENEKLDKYDYPWFKVRSFRNLIAHEYFNIKLSAVWLIIENDLPELKTVIAEILKNEYSKY